MHRRSRLLDCLHRGHSLRHVRPQCLLVNHLKNRPHNKKRQKQSQSEQNLIRRRLLQTERLAQNGENNDGWVYSAAYNVTSDIKLKAQYGESDIVKDNAKTYSLGADYKLAKAAKVYAFVTDEEFGDNSSNEYYGMGLEYKF